eukprot:c24223_g1_i1 orf=399-746(+)
MQSASMPIQILSHFTFLPSTWLGMSPGDILPFPPLRLGSSKAMFHQPLGRQLFQNNSNKPQIPVSPNMKEEISDCITKQLRHTHQRAKMALESSMIMTDAKHRFQHHKHCMKETF